MQVSLTMTARQHREISEHLFPGDGCEAVALLLCGRARGLSGSREPRRLVVHRVVPIPHAVCTVRTPVRVTWQTHPFVFDMLVEAARRGMAIAKIHSHPTGVAAFSPIDDASDRELFGSVFSFLDTLEEQASAIMLPDGRIFGRWFNERLEATPLSHVGVIGDDIRIWAAESLAPAIGAHGVRTVRVFGQGTYALLRKLRFAVIGCSGTGSIVIEQLARLGAGHLILVDPDIVEYKNLNRIINATSEDAALRRPKVEVIARAIARMGLGTTVDTRRENLLSPSCVRVVSTADIVFGCMDGVEGRNALNRLAAAYLLPYFDVGVRLDADGKGGVEDIWGTVHYVRPDGSSLMDRGVYAREDLDAEALLRTDPTEYQRRRRQGYIRGIAEDRPAVISTNMLYAAFCVNEFLARVHPFRWSDNAGFAAHRYSPNRNIIIAEPDGVPSLRLANLVGRGDMRPLLDMAELSE